jgi:thiamine kinase-like enzyme
VEAPGMDPIIVRIPSKGTEAYINRAAEIENVRAAARAGVAPPVLYADTATGIMVSRCVSNSLTMTVQNFKSVAGAAGRAGAALRQLHQSGAQFSGRFELFTMIEQYLTLLKEKRAGLPYGYHELVAAARPVHEVLTARPAALAPCHCDPLAENFLDDGTKIWIVDYEYSGMNDPMWDLGDLSVEAEFTEAQEQEMLADYFGRAPGAAEQGRIVIYKAMCDLLWTLWGLIQHADANPADDFWAYANRRFARCKALMRQEAFSRHIGAVWSG